MVDGYTYKSIDGNTFRFELSNPGVVLLGASSLVLGSVGLGIVGLNLVF